MENHTTISKKRKVIFLAEDDQDDIFLFQTALSDLRLGHQLLVFENGQLLLDAFKMGSFEKPDIVFLDINMPLKTGLETLVDIRSRISRQLPVFLLSTAQDSVNVETARRSGATGYLSKPDAIEELSEMLSKVLSVNWQKRSMDDFYVHLQFCKV